jgi:Uma2 family endonuclease
VGEIAPIAPRSRHDRSTVTEPADWHYIVTPAGNRRQADGGVDCGTPDDMSMDADRPTMVLEVLSPTTRQFDRFEKVEEYKTVPTLEYIVLVDPDCPQVRLFSRLPDRSWTSTRLAGLDAELELPRIDFRLPLRALYAGLSFQSGPTLVEPTGSSRYSI